MSTYLSAYSYESKSAKQCYYQGFFVHERAARNWFRYSANCMLVPGNLPSNPLIVISLVLVSQYMLFIKTRTNTGDIVGAVGLTWLSAEKILSVRNEMPWLSA